MFREGEAARHGGSEAQLTHPIRSSHDLLADRRFDWACAMVQDGDDEAAADLLGQVVDRVPHWAPGWAALAQANDRLRRREAALAAWHRVMALDDADSFGAALQIARLTGAAPSTMPDAYVAALFDNYAPRFERHLVQDLGYCGPRLLVEAVDRLWPDRRFGRVLDLGCGTGLMGRAIRDRADRIDGVDLSPGMIERARAQGLYDRLITGSIDTALASLGEGTYDLVLAADVLAYVGDLAPVLRGVARMLVVGGPFAFTLQAADPRRAGPTGILLGDDLRFAHTEAHVEVCATEAGLALLTLEDGPVRTERGAAVPGWVAVVHR